MQRLAVEQLVEVIALFVIHVRRGALRRRSLKQLIAEDELQLSALLDAASGLGL
jgi:uncharacterized membrane protein YciS (DUF1049 family)